MSCFVLPPVVFSCVLVYVAFRVLPSCGGPLCLPCGVWCVVEIYVLCRVLFPCCMLPGFPLPFTSFFPFLVPRRLLPLVSCVVFCLLVLFCGADGLVC